MPNEMRLPWSFASCAAHQAANVCQRARQRFAGDAGGLGGTACGNGSVAESVIAGGLRSCGGVLVATGGDCGGVNDAGAVASNAIAGGTCTAGAASAAAGTG